MLDHNNASQGSNAMPISRRTLIATLALAPAGFAAFVSTDYGRMRDAAKLAGLEPK
jgi:hypothetical protein